MLAIKIVVKLPEPLQRIIATVSKTEILPAYNTKTTKWIALRRHISEKLVEGPELEK